MLSVVTRSVTHLDGDEKKSKTTLQIHVKGNHRIIACTIT